MASQGFEQLLDDCEEHDSKLSDWERDFLDSIRGYICRSDYMTSSQIATLEQIWERATREDRP